MKKTAYAWIILFSAIIGTVLSFLELVHVNIMALSGIEPALLLIDIIGVLIGIVFISKLLQFPKGVAKWTYIYFAFVIIEMIYYAIMFSVTISSDSAILGPIPEPLGAILHIFVTGVIMIFIGITFLIMFTFISHSKKYYRIYKNYKNSKNKNKKLIITYL